MPRLRDEFNSRISLQYPKTFTIENGQSFQITRSSKEINHKKGSFANRRNLKAFDNIDQVVANSEYTKNLAIEIGIDGNKIIVINPGVFPPKEIDKSSIEELWQYASQPPEPPERRDITPPK